MNPTALTARLRSLSLSGNSSPTRISPRPCVSSLALTMYPENQELVHIIDTCITAPKTYREEEMLESAQAPINEILAHCKHHMHSLSGEALLLRIVCIVAVYKVYAPIIATNELLYSSLCTLVEPFFQQIYQPTRMDALYGDIAWFHECHKRPYERLSLVKQLLTSQEFNEAPRAPCEPSVILCDAKHPWHLQKLPARTAVHDWYALSYWVTKLATLRPPRGSMRPTEQLWYILAQWATSSPPKSGTAIVQASAALSLIDTFLEPDKLPAGEKSPRRQPHAPETISKFKKFCLELTAPLDFTLWKSQPDATLITQWTLPYLPVDTMLEVLGAQYAQNQEDQRFSWLTKINSLEGNHILQVIRDKKLDHSTLFQFLPWLILPNTNFSLRFSLIQEIFTQLTTRNASIAEIKQFFTQLHVFFDEAKAEGFTKIQLHPLVDAVFAMPWYVANAPKTFMKAPDKLPDVFQDILSIVLEIEGNLDTPHFLKNKLCEKYIQLFTKELESIQDPSQMALKNCLLSLIQVCTPT